MRFLLDTDHISILQREAGAEFVALSMRIARHDPTDLAFSVISFHEQTLGCHTSSIKHATRRRLSEGMACSSG